MPFPAKIGAATIGRPNGASAEASSWRPAGGFAPVAIHHPPHPAHVLDRCLAELLADVMDEKFHGVAFDFLVPTIEALFELAARKDGARAQQQGVQQRVLSSGQTGVKLARARF